MSPTALDRSATSLRAITHYLSTSPNERLPSTISPLLSSISNCSELLSSGNLSTKDRSEGQVLVHKFTTQISTLLQGRTVEERWTAVALIKATVEAGGWQILSGCGAWVRGLLGILGKPDPPTTKKLTIIALTRIFVLTQEHQTLVRELTTPSLPGFINSTIQLISIKGSSPARQLDLSSPLVGTVLDCFNHLLPRHSTIFRPFRTEIHALLLPLIVPTSGANNDGPSSLFSNAYISEETSNTARCLFVRLHHCAPKNTSAEEWKSMHGAVIRTAHSTVDQVFRAVIEDWEPTADALSRSAESRSFSEDVGGTENNPMNLAAWSGIHDGFNRLRDLLKVLAKFFELPTASIIPVRIDYTMDLLTRIFSLTVPPDHEGWQASARLNTEIGRDEREALWARLPDLHVAAMDTLRHVVRRLGQAFIPMSQAALDQLLWVFRAENWSAEIRTSTYSITTELLKLTGSSFSKSISLSKLVQSCCEDLLSVSVNEQTSTTVGLGDSNKSRNGVSSTDADSYLKPSVAYPSKSSKDLPGLSLAASILLPHFLINLPSNFLSFSLRSQIDRTAILVQHDKAMLASVLNPPSVKGNGKIGNSILPFLARSVPGQLETEGILRPRMPVINARTGTNGETNSDSEDESHDDIDPRPTGSDFQPHVSVSDFTRSSTVPSTTDIIPSTADFSRDADLGHEIESARLLVAPPASPKPTKRIHDTLSLSSEQGRSSESSDGLPPKRIRTDPPVNLEYSTADNAHPTLSQTRLGETEVLGVVHESRPKPSTITESVTSQSLPETAEDSDDDFEIPPLTMDADTEDEDEIAVADPEGQ